MNDRAFAKPPSRKLKEQAKLSGKKSKERYVEDEELHKILVVNSPIGIYIVQDGRFKFVNHKFKEYSGFSEEELLGRETPSLVHPEDREIARQNAILMLKGKLPLPYEFRTINKKGEVLWNMETVASITYRGQRATLGSYMDITRQKDVEEALRKSEERFRTIIETIEEGYGEVDFDGNITFANESWLRISGYRRDEFTEMNLREYLDQEDVPKLFQTFDEVRKTGKASRGIDLKFVRKDGSKRYIETSVSLITDTNGRPVGFRGVIRDITERRQMEDTIRKLAYHDPLTGLPNRLLLNDRLSMAMARAKRNKKKLTLMMLDLDKFKEVNDTLGHQMGDCLLRVVGDRLAGLLRKGDTVGRLGGDEFMVLLPEIKKAKDSVHVAQKILASFQEPFPCNDHKLSITTSIGIAFFPDHVEDGDTLMKNADIAMYRAKERGRNNYQIFAETIPSRN
jgi:diguanylate cyclase (GGDEF)-like protein/PAS domain S-box-containing protein